MILSVGCSFTEGAELANPDTHAYPRLIANEYNLPLKNLGLGGGSNDYIFKTVVEETLKTKYELVLVQWTAYMRQEILFHGEIINVSGGSRWVDNEELSWLKTYYTYHYADSHRFKDWICKTITLQHYLNSINQKFLFFTMMPLDDNLLNDETIAPFWDKLDKRYFLDWPTRGIVDWIGDDKAPGGHPNEVGHARIAERINEHIRSLGWLS
jgi:lysophospholipase L1-like esterase